MNTCPDPAPFSGLSWSPAPPAPLPDSAAAAGRVALLCMLIGFPVLLFLPTVYSLSLEASFFFVCPIAALVALGAARRSFEISRRVNAPRSGAAVAGVVLASMFLLPLVAFVALLLLSWLVFSGVLIGVL